MIAKENTISNTNQYLPTSTFSINELYDAYLECRKGKYSMNIAIFEQNVEVNLFNLLDELNKEMYHISSSICFIVKKPKIREIWASDFRDRIVHHLITRKIETFYENNGNPFSFLDSSYANRKNKGTHKAVEKVKQLIKTNSYYLKMDIKSFFNTIDRNTLFTILKQDLNDEEFIQKQEIMALFKQIIFHNYTHNYYSNSSNEEFKLIPYHKSLFSAEKNNKGLPIGNLTSQFLSNIYLNKLDYFIEKQLGFSNYVRYVDDFVILSNNKEELRDSISKINTFLQQELKLELHPNKIILQNVSEGIDFLGYYIKPTHTLVRKTVVGNLKEKIQNKNKKQLSREEILVIRNIVNSYFGHFKHANSYNLKWKMSKKLQNYFELEKKKENTVIKPKSDLNFETVMEQYAYFKNKYEGQLIVFQMGNFYRFFDEQAEFASKMLDLKSQIKKYSKHNHLICGFPINNPNKLNLIENLGYNYCIIEQNVGELSSGLKERREKSIVQNKNHLYLKGRSYQSQSEDLNSILSWDLNSMSPIEVFNKIHTIIQNNKTQSLATTRSVVFETALKKTNGK